MTLNDWLVAGLLAGAFLLAGTMDAEDALREQDRYCEMVKQGAWPDYDRSIKCHP